MAEPRTTQFKTFYWNYIETEDNELEIHVGGRTAPDPDGETKSVHCVIENFTPFVYLELPKRIKWNKAKCIAVYEYFKKVMKSEGPIGFKLLQKYKLQHKKLCNCIWLTFPTNKAAHNLARRCHNTKSGLFVDGVGVFRSKEFTVHETNLDPLLKFTASMRLKLASWISVKETISPGDTELDVEDRKFTTADIDLRADWQDVEAFVPKGMVIVRPKYMSFDIECNSKNHNSRLPDPEIPENCIFQIGNTVGKFGEHPKFRRKFLFTLGNPHDIPDVTVIRCTSEKDLLLRWRTFVNDENPDVMVGYNIMKFDWNYMIHRAEKLGIYMKFAQISRIIGQRAKNEKSAWSSSAYGEQNFRYLDPMGRTNVDVLLEIERNFKLPQYGLNAVGEYFLKEHKDDITPRQLFMLFQLTMELGPIVDILPKGIVKKEKRIEIKKQIQEILQMRRCHGIVKKLRTDLMNAKKGIEFQNLVRDAFTLTGTYCVQDTVLPVNLCEKLNLWTTMEETSNCMNVPMSYLHTRGQQIKVLAQVYRDTIFNDIIIPYRDKIKDGETERYEGAIVIEANPGDYDNVACFDFESLYPSVMIAYNICHTTLLEKDDPTPDDQCHVLEINTHVGCSHDPQRRKKKKENVMCFHHTHRFKKVIIRPDGTRENEGIMAKLVRNLLVERKVVKKEMAKLEAKMKMAKGLAQEEDIAFYKKMGWDVVEKGSLSENALEILDVEIKVLNAKQLALKVSANSSYGTLGAQTGPIPLVAGAEAVTAMGRMLIMKAIEYILKKNPGVVEVGKSGYEETIGKAKLVYGDSVTPDTPILIKINEKKGHRGLLKYVNIEDIPRKTPWMCYGEKEYAIPKDGVEVWSDKGFTRIKEIIRHKTDKDIYRVLTHTGCVDVTEDHSLLRADGKEIRPKDVSIGDKLLHSELPTFERRDQTIVSQSPAQGCPYSMGFFYGDGSCGHYDCPSGSKSSWALNNTNLDFLNRAKKELETFYPFEFVILDTLESSGAYKLVPKGQGIRSLVEEWREYFYSSRKQKKVPDDILNASDKTVKAFMEGYYAADGDKGGNYRFDNKGGIGAAGLLYLCNRMGYSTSINIREDKTDIYRVTATKSYQRKPGDVIKKIWNFGPSNDYVYDLETENHHFAAGVGKMIVHNTDSSMITLTGKSTEESFLLGDKISKETSHYLKTLLLEMEEEFSIKCPDDDITYRIDKYPRDKMKNLSDEDKVEIYRYDACPINLQFENLYKRYLLLSKKRYVAYAVNRKGEIVAKIKKGVVLARRDNCQYLRDTYKIMTDGILEYSNESAVMYILYDQVQKLFTRQIPDANLIIYTGIKTIMNYAKRKEIKQGRTVTDRVFLDEDGEAIDDPFGPLDPRLVYPNLPQVLLSMKMLKRGDDIPPNTRLEYLYLETEGAEHQGEKAEDYTFYKENRDIYNFTPDYLHYIEKQLSKPVTELLEVKYPRSKVPYEKLDDALERVIELLDDLLKHRTKQVKLHERSVTERHDSIRFGWAAKWCAVCKSKFPKLCSKHNPNTTCRTYTYRRKMAQVQYILDSAERKKLNPKALNEVNERKYPEVVKICKKYKARYILDTLYSQHGIRKRPAKRATQTGEKLRIKTKDEFVKVLLTKDLYISDGVISEKITEDIYRKGDLVKLKDIRTEEDSTARSVRKKYKYFYTIECSDGTIVENVPRDAFTTWYYKDGSVMKDILVARTCYKNVVKELNILFDPLNFIGAGERKVGFVEIPEDDEE